MKNYIITYKDTDFLNNYSLGKSKKIFSDLSYLQRFFSEIIDLKKTIQPHDVISIKNELNRELTELEFLSTDKKDIKIYSKDLCYQENSEYIKFIAYQFPKREYSLALFYDKNTDIAYLIDFPEKSKNIHFAIETKEKRIVIKNNQYMFDLETPSFTCIELEYDIGNKISYQNNMATFAKGVFNQLLIRDELAVFHFNPNFPFSSVAIENNNIESFKINKEFFKQLYKELNIENKELDILEQNSFSNVIKHLKENQDMLGLLKDLPSFNLYEEKELIEKAIYYKNNFTIVDNNYEQYLDTLKNSVILQIKQSEKNIDKNVYGGNFLKITEAEMIDKSFPEFNLNNIEKIVSCLIKKYPTDSNKIIQEKKVSL